MDRHRKWRYMFRKLTSVIHYIPGTFLRYEGTARHSRSFLRCNDIQPDHKAGDEIIVIRREKEAFGSSKYFWYLQDSDLRATALTETGWNPSYSPGSYVVCLSSYWVPALCP